MKISGATTISWSSCISPTFYLPKVFSVWSFRNMTPFCGNDSRKEDEMIVSIHGATGFIGKTLVQKLQADNHHVRVLTRSKSRAMSIFPVSEFPKIEIAEESEWKRCIQGSTAVVNLAGLPISQKWTPEVKKEIKESRMKATSKVVDIMNSLELRPKVFVSASAIGYYGVSETSEYDEQSPSGNDFLAEVCRDWEAAALRVNNDVRVVLIRIGVVLGKDGGALAGMIPPFRLFLGGRIGSGKQWFSWIHEDDQINLICEAISNPSYKGAINATAPNPVRMSEMCDELARALGRPSWLPLPGFVIKAALGEGASVVLEGQKVIPTKAKQLGFSFKYPILKDALGAILSS